MKLFGIYNKIDFINENSYKKSLHLKSKIFLFDNYMIIKIKQNSQIKYRYFNPIQL